MKNTICAIMKNEGPYILEWLAYHQAVGIEHFVIYDNLSQDGSYELLRKLESAGVVKTYRQHEKDGGSPQLKAYNHCIRYHGDDTDLMTFIDADEFLTPLDGVDLPSYLTGTFRDHPAMTAMGVNWKVFGSSGHQTKDDGLVIERFTKCADRCSSVVKTVVRPIMVKEMFIHIAELKAGRYGDEQGRRVEFIPADGGVPGSITAPSNARLQVNHYMVKSREEFEIKRARGNANYTSEHAEKFRRFNDEYFIRHDVNAAEDLSAQRFLDRTRELLQDLERIASS